MTYPQPTQQTPTTPKTTARQWAIPFTVAAVAVLAIIIASVLSSGDSSSPADEPLFISRIEVVHDSCGAGELSDGGRTLLLDLEGEDIGSGTATVEDAACVLVALGAPSSVTSRMDATRALDGMQDATWDGYSATWTYHPSDGLDMIITEN